MENNDQLIERITKQVLQALNQNTGQPVVAKTQSRNSGNNVKNNPMNYSNSAIILLTGGNKELQEVNNQMSIIARRHSKVYVVMTRSATQIIGVPQARSASQGGEIITDYTAELIEEIIPKVSTIYVPVLSLNTAAKVAALNADTLGTITMVFGLLNGKAVIAAKDSIFCCQIEPENIPPAVLSKINSIINELQNLGVQMTDVRGLTGGNVSVTVSSPNIDVQSNSQQVSYTTGTSGKIPPLNGNSLKVMVNSGASRISAKPNFEEFDKEMAHYIDHTILKADATDEEIRVLCAEAVKYGFASVCVNPTNVAKAYNYTKGSPVKVCTVIGFPLGATTPTVKGIEARDAIANGAEEVDMVINVGALKSSNDELVKEDIQAVVNAAKEQAIVKVILETALLTKEEIAKGSLLAKLAGANFVKTSTGFSTGGAKVEDIELMRRVVGPEMGVKASGGIRTHDDAEQMIKAGATRIGASASIAIVKGTTSSSKGY